MNRIKVTPLFFAAFLVIAIFAGIAPSAVGINGESDLFEELKPLVDIYNQNVDRIPFLLKGPIADERIHAEISLNDGTVLILGITTDNEAKIMSFERGEISDPTIKAYTTENTVRSIMDSEDPVSAFQAALDTGAITYEGVGFVNKLKYGAIGFFWKILSPFI
ncbi:MAG: hypothetical protein IBX41_05040 [Methanophagales archaeon]|nr:hypothetical protein [Methanophagales archaeon]